MDNNLTPRIPFRDITNLKTPTKSRHHLNVKGQERFESKPIQTLLQPNDDKILPHNSVTAEATLFLRACDSALKQLTSRSQSLRVAQIGRKQWGKQAVSLLQQQKQKELDKIETYFAQQLKDLQQKETKQGEWLQEQAQFLNGHRSILSEARHDVVTNLSTIMQLTPSQFQPLIKLYWLKLKAAQTKGIKGNFSTETDFIETRLFQPNPSAQQFTFGKLNELPTVQSQGQFPDC